MRSSSMCAAAWVGAIAIASLATEARADIVYDETSQADVSGDYQNPEPIALLYGVNSIILNTGYDEFGNFDVDYLRVDLPAGGSIAHLNLTSYSGESVSFTGFQAGSAMTFDPEVSDFDCISECLGLAHFGANDISSDLLPVLNTFAMDLGQPGFSIPLLAPNYTFWLQETSFAVDYQLDFVVSLPGDYNGDHFVNAADYTVWRNTLGNSVADGEGADGDFDGVVGPNDYQVWKTYYGEMAVGFGSGASVEQFGGTVPEPGTGLLLFAAVGTGALFFRPRRKN